MKKAMPAGRQGFTLVELLVTISIIGILSALVLVSFTGAQKQARDTGRKSDLKQYQVALETYANKNDSLYSIETLTVSADEDLCVNLGLTSCPADAKNGTDPYGYKYQSDAGGTIYVLWAALENSVEYYVVCSNGKAGTKLRTGFSVTGGACPL